MGDTLHDNPSDPPFPAAPPDPAQPSDPGPANEPAPAFANEAAPAPANEAAPANAPVAQAEPPAGQASAPDGALTFTGPAFRGEPIPFDPAASTFAPQSELPQVQPSQSWARRWWMLLVVAVVIVLGGAAVLVAALTTRPERLAFPIGGCVSLDKAAGVDAIPVEYDCTNSYKAQYRITAREEVAYPIPTACVKYSDATRAVLPPTDPGSKPKVVLCLAPTRFNTSDPGQLQPGDCIDVQKSGDIINRVDCGFAPKPEKVVAVEIHAKVPAQQSCKDQPAARAAFAQSSLGGRAVVVCTVSTDPLSIHNAKVGDCADGKSSKTIPCTDPRADQRVLSVHVLNRQPARPECPDDLGASGSFMTTNQNTDLVLLLCTGPADPNSSRYAVVGDCIGETDPNSTSASATFRVDCGDPRAGYKVIDRHDSDDNSCPAGTNVSLTYPPGVTTGSTVCLRRR